VKPIPSSWHCTEVRKEAIPLATPYKSTLLDLAQAVSEFATTDDEILATVTHLSNGGKVLLGGTFAGARIDLAPRPRITPSSLFHITAARQARAL
jgi:hypothetical protein